MTQQAKKNEAKRLYCELELSAKIIADKLQCNIKSIYAWRDKYGWQRHSSTCVIRLSRKEYKDLVTDVNKIADEALRGKILKVLMSGQSI